MKYKDLPESKAVGLATNTNDLADLFEKATKESPGPFEYHGPAVGGPRSCRLLFQREMEGFTDMVALPYLYDYEEMAAEFFGDRFALEVRYNPPNAPSKMVVKGWEVRRIVIGHHIIVVVLAAWVPTNRYTPVNGEGPPSPE